jgi:hypothetical protein
MTKQIKFIEGKESDIPQSGKKASAEQVTDIEKVFQSHFHNESSSGSSSAKPRCHIIACVIDDEGVTCWYHCV